MTERQTWYLFKMVLHTPVTSIMVTRIGMSALFSAILNSHSYTEFQL